MVLGGVRLEFSTQVSRDEHYSHHNASLFLVVAGFDSLS
jgi:hypothetical protein